MSTKLNSIISDGSLYIDTDMDISYQCTFSANAPHCNVPAVNGNDLVTLGYVNSLVGQYSGGFNLFFNYSVSDGLYKSLGQSVVDSVTQQIVPITTDTTNQLVAKFVSSALGITTIPSGIWNMLIYSEVAANGGTLTYFFEVYTLTGATETLLFTSASSADVNANTTPAGINVNGTLITPATIALTDKIVVKIYLHKDGTPLLVNTYFQYDYYSFIQTTLNAGTTLLSSDNTFTGTNSFTNTTTNIGSMVVLANALNSNSINTDIFIGDNLIGPGIATPGGKLKIGNNMNWGEISIARKTGRLGETHIHDGTGSAGSVYIGSTSTNIQIAVGTTSAANGPINIGNGAGSIGAFSLGSATRLLTVLGTSASTISTGIITLLQTPTAYPAGGNTVPTVSWVTDAFTYFKTQAQTWDLAQTFTTVPINNGTIGLGSANDTNVPSTAWVQTALTYFKTQAQTWDLAQTFTSQPITNATITAYPFFDSGLVTSTWVKNAINYAEKGKITSASVPALALTQTLTFVNTYTTIPLVLLTVDMGSGTVIVSCALAGTTLTTFNYILSSLSGVSSLNYYVITI